MISNFKHSTGLIDVNHDQMDSREQAMSGINKYFDEYFHLKKHFVQSWPVLGWPSQQASESKLDTS